MNMKDYLTEALSKLEIELSDEQVEQLEIYYNLLVEWNSKINLTAITDGKGVAVKHFADSLSLLRYVDIPKNAKVADIGTGAGFPGLVLKIARPDIQLTLIDSLKKRFLFLDEVLNSLSLDAEKLAGRAEQFGGDIDYRESFDIVVSRAVARLNVLSEYAIPLVRLSGSFIPFKAVGASQELEDSKRAIQTLGGKIKKVHDFDLPLDGGHRILIEIEKINPTPDKYPRNNGKIKSKPL